MFKLRRSLRGEDDAEHCVVDSFVKRSLGPEGDSSLKVCSVVKKLESAFVVSLIVFYEPKLAF